VIAVPSDLSHQTILVEARSAQTDIEGCSPVPGFSTGDIDQDAKYLLFGQRYGTKEFVAQFGNIVCALSRMRPLTVALEWPVKYSQAFSAYLADPKQDAEKALLALPIWDKASADGRSSEAMFQLLRLLRRLRFAGRDIEVTSYIPATSGQNGFEGGMADQLKLIGTKGRLVVALMGDLHATKGTVPDPTHIFPPDNIIDPTANRLPSDEVISIHLESKGGVGWGLSGAYQIPKYGGGSTLWSLYASPIGGFDGRLFIGSPATVSPPLAR
jgi:hypothetical protein